MATSPLMITVAPNGARKTKQDLPQIPLTPEELAVEAKNCRDAGAVMIHLHVRDEMQRHSLDIGYYQQATNAIRRAVGQDIILQVTSEAVGIYTPEEQMNMVRRLQPEAVSLAIRELIPSADKEQEAGLFFGWCQTNDIAQQYILYSPEEVAYFATLCQKGVIPAGPKFILLVLGKKTGGEAAQPLDLDPYLDNWPLGDEVTWAICAFGSNERDCLRYAVEKGGHVRMGFENNHHLANGDIAPSNAALVKQFCASATFELADVETARRIMGVKEVVE